MNHGLIASEITDDVGAAVWRYAAESGESLLLYAEAMMGESSSTHDNPWSRARLRPLGDVVTLETAPWWNARQYTAACAVYSPKNQEDFSRMCLECSIRGWPAMATASGVADDAAAAVLSDFWQSTDEISRNLSEGKPTKIIVQKRDVRSIRWGYFVGFYYEEPTTVFLSTDPEAVATVARMGGESAGWRLSVMW